MRKSPFRKFIVLILAISFLGQTFSAYGQIGPINPPLPNFNPATLKYLSVNTANPYNYFNFLLDKGSYGVLASSEGIHLNSEAKKLINYFFLGLTLPGDAFWVNLKPLEPDRITSTGLSQTDLGKTLLEQDLRLKKDMSQYLNPQNPTGALFWERLYSEIEKQVGKDKLKKTAITTSNRVWIVPDKVVVLETEDGALISEAKLKVLLESEYAAMESRSHKSGVETPQNQTSDFLSQASDTRLQALTEQLMKEIIIPAITKDVNEAQSYAPLRQVYYSLILAQWFKHKHKNDTSAYAQAINEGYLKGLESQVPWEKQVIWQDYLKSYKEGEYKFIDKAIFNLKRMYFSGGIIIPELFNSGLNAQDGSSPIVQIGSSYNDQGSLIAPAAEIITNDDNKSLVIYTNGTNPQEDGLAGKEEVIQREVVAAGKETVGSPVVIDYITPKGTKFSFPLVEDIAEALAASKDVALKTPPSIEQIKNLKDLNYEVALSQPKRRSDLLFFSSGQSGSIGSSIGYLLDVYSQTAVNIHNHPVEEFAMPSAADVDSMVFDSEYIIVGKAGITKIKLHAADYEAVESLMPNLQSKHQEVYEKGWKQNGSEFIEENKDLFDELKVAGLEIEFKPWDKVTAKDINFVSSSPLDLQQGVAEEVSNIEIREQRIKIIKNDLLFFRSQGNLSDISDSELDRLAELIYEAQLNTDEGMVDTAALRQKIQENNINIPDNKINALAMMGMGGVFKDPMLIIKDEKFERLIGDVVQHGVILGVENGFVFRNGHLGQLIVDKRNHIDFGLDKGELDVHWHPIGGTLEPSWQDLIRDIGQAVVVVVWGTEKFGFYAAAVDMRNIKNREELDKIGKIIGNDIGNLGKFGYAKYYRLKFIEDVAFSHQIKEGKARFQFIEMSPEEKEIVIQNYKKAEKYLVQEENASVLRHARKNGEDYKNRPKIEIEEQVRETRDEIKHLTDNLEQIERNSYTPLERRRAIYEKIGIDHDLQKLKSFLLGLELALVQRRQNVPEEVFKLFSADQIAQADSLEKINEYMAKNAEMFKLAINQQEEDVARLLGKNRELLFQRKKELTGKSKGIDVNLAAGDNFKAPHSRVNNHIRNNLPQDVRDNPGNIVNYKQVEAYGIRARIIPIQGLFRVTGQFAHIGLGQAYGEPVIYVDADYVENSTVLNHELYEISKWEAERQKLRLQPQQMRQWIFENYEQAKKMADKWHDEAPSLDILFFTASYRMQGLLDSLAKAAGLTSPVVFEVEELGPSYAFVNLDGKVHIAKGFLDLVQKGIITDREFAALLAHEIAHLVNEDTLRKLYKDELGLSDLEGDLEIARWINAAEILTKAGLSYKDIISFAEKVKSGAIDALVKQIGMEEHIAKNGEKKTTPDTLINAILKHKNWPMQTMEIKFQKVALEEFGDYYGVEQDINLGAARRESSINSSLSVSSLLKIIDISPIDENRNKIIRSREDFERLIEAPLLEACNIFYDKNIQTLSSSANKKDLKFELLGDGRHYAYIIINYNSLSDENKIIADEIAKNSEALEDAKVMKLDDYDGMQAIQILVPITEQSIIQEVSDKVVKIAGAFKKQKMTWVPKYAIEDLRRIYHSPDATIQDFKEEGYFYNEKDSFFYLSQEHINKFQGGDAVISLPNEEASQGLAPERVNGDVSSPLGHGGIDLSKIEITLKDEKFISSLNSADLKILRAARAVKQGWNSLAVLYVHEVRLLLENKIVSEKDMSQWQVLQNLLTQIANKGYLDSQTIEFQRSLQFKSFVSKS